MTGKLPPSASVAHKLSDAKLFAPSAERNAPALAALMAELAPAQGDALEVASGTGQHISAFAQACPQIIWQPSEISPDRIASIDAYAAGFSNVRPAIKLDVCTADWAVPERYDLIVLCNLLHLITPSAASMALSGAAKSLKRGGLLVVYGPFSRRGTLTSEGDKTFDAELRTANSKIGYKDDTWIEGQLNSTGLAVNCQEMPANNLAFIGQKK